MSRVLALKYRPKRFSDLIGQESVSQTLSLGLKTEKLSHAYLFSGLRGSGKTSTARIFAKALVCENTPVAEPCGVCAGCISAEEGRHLDIIEMDAASNRGIDDIRQLIESTKYKPSIAKHKIYIIDEVHMLSTPAFNALLKTLEEPPSYVKFILATTDPIKLPPTILSRTIHFRFKKIGQSDVVEHLKHILGKEGISFEEEALEFIARNGSGSLRDTLTLLDQAIVFSKGFVSSVSVVELLGAVNPDKIRELFSFVLEKDRERALLLVKEFEDYEAENVINEIMEFLKASIGKKNKNIPLFVLERFFRIAVNAKELLFMGADGDFVLTLTLLKMIEALEIEDIDSLIAKYESEVDFTQVPSEDMVRDKGLMEQDKEPVKSVNTKSQWDKLVEALYDRSHEVGSVFENNIAFVSFDNGVLTWSSSAEGGKYELLKKYYSQIKHIVQDIYGISTTIAVQKNTNKSEDANIPVVSTKEESVNNDATAVHSLDSDDSSEENEYIQSRPGLFGDEEDMGEGESKSLEAEAEELSLLRHPLVEKTKEVFGVGDSNISIFQKV
jgi:DNA polymerase-3 subunit gamma/tau